MRNFFSNVRIWQPVGCPDYLDGADESPLLFFRAIEAVDAVHLLHSDGLSILRPWAFQLLWTFKKETTDTFIDKQMLPNPLSPCYMVNNQKVETRNSLFYQCFIYGLLYCVSIYIESTEAGIWFLAILWCPCM